MTTSATLYLLYLTNATYALRGSILILLFIILSPWCVAQYQIVNRLKIQDGLPSNTIYQISTDSKGFVWLATKNGLTKYDGSQFWTYNAVNGLYENEIIGLQHFGKDELITNAFIKRFNIIVNKKIFALDSYLIPNKQSMDFFSFQHAYSVKFHTIQDQLFVCFKSGSKSNHNVFLLHNKKFADIHKTFNLPTAHTFKDIGKISDREFLLVSVDRRDEKTYLSYIENWKIRYTTAISSLPSNFQLFTIDTNCFLKFNDSVYVYKINHSIKKMEVVKKMKYSQDINKIAKIDSLYIFINSYGYSTIFSTSNLIKTKLPIFDSIKNITDIYPDKMQNIWISTLNDGLLQLKRNKNNFPIWAKNIGVPYILHIAKDTLLFGDNQGNIYQLVNRSKLKKIFSAKNYVQRESNNIRYINTYKDHILLAFDIGFFILDKKFRTIFKYTDGASIKAVTISDDGMLYLGTSFLVYKLNFNKLKMEDAQIVNERVTGLHLDSKNQLWYATREGLFLKSLNNSKPAKDLSYLSSRFQNHINSIQYTQDNIIWVTTASHGIYAIKNQTIIGQITDEKIIKNATIQCVHINANTIWIGTNKGLYKLTYRIEGNTLRTVLMAVYDIRYGLPENSILSINQFDTTIAIGTNIGLSLIPMQNFDKKRAIHTYLNKIEFNHVEKPIESSYRVLHNENIISVHYTGLNYDNQYPLRYQIKVSGLGSKWYETDEKSKDIGPLNHGKYSITVRCVDAISKPLGKQVQIDVEILPPFYQTWWFRLIVLFSFLAIIYTFIKWYWKKKGQENSMKLEMIKLEMAAIRAQINPHFIFNCLSSIQNLITKQDSIVANKFIAKFAHLIRQTLELSKSNVITLVDEIEYLETYLALEKLRFKDQFDYTIYKDENIPYSNLQIPSMLLQPYVENAIKHGIRHLIDKKGIIMINFQRKENMITCTIDDNGVGRDYTSNFEKNYQSRGTELNERRISTYNSLYQQNITVRFVDKKNDFQEALGTTIIISIPINLSDDKSHNS